MANILICDDDVDIVSALKIYLSNEDYKIYTAFTGKQALDCVKEHDIDLVLMDVMMPEMDGIAATAKLREEYNIPVTHGQERELRQGARAQRGRGRLRDKALRPHRGAGPRA